MKRYLLHEAAEWAFILMGFVLAVLLDRPIVYLASGGIILWCLGKWIVARVARTREDSK
jgi:mannose/fructose/N-acetylgalactosamine-specific phosphotransferase system component IIC